MINPKTDRVCVTMPLRLKTAETNDAGSHIISKVKELSLLVETISFRFFNKDIV